MALAASPTSHKTGSKKPARAARPSRTADAGSESDRGASVDTAPDADPEMMRGLDTHPDATVDAQAFRSAVQTIGSFVADFDPRCYSGEDAALLVSWFTKGERQCAAGKTLAAARAAASHVHTRGGHKTPAHWLAEVTGESVGQAIDVLRLGEAIEEHPGVADAYRNGKLSASGAKVVAGAVEVNPASEGELLEVAERDSLTRLRHRCLQAKAEGRSKVDASKAYEAIRAARHCRTWTDSEGALRLEASFTPDAGASLLVSLERACSRVFEQARKSGRREPRDAYRADALVALVAGRGAVGGQDSSGSSGARPGHAAASEPTGASDAGGSVNPPIGTTRGRGAPLDTGCRSPDSKAVVHLRVDLDALRRGSVATGDTCEIPGVGPVPIETARELLGDALIQLVITNGVDVTTICHLGRSIPAPLKTALIERDRTCVVPGCDAANGLEIDHWAVSFAHGGPASLANLARLCGHHHYLRTHRGFQLGGGPGRWSWTPPVQEGSATTSGRSSPTNNDEPDQPLFTIEESAGRTRSRLVPCHPEQRGIP